MNGLDAARLISQLAPQTAMLMFTMHPSKELLKAARAAGVRDVVSKIDPLSDHLSSALRLICA
jgi:DNA-binding NarL/FixJ family response regulator